MKSRLNVMAVRSMKLSVRIWRARRELARVTLDNRVAEDVQLEDNLFPACFAMLKPVRNSMACRLSEFMPKMR